MRTIEELNGKLTTPSPHLVGDVACLDEDILILGAGGKMGPSLAGLAKKAIDQAGLSSNVICVSRFSDKACRQELDSQGIQTVAADLLNEEELQGLPDAGHVIYMVGQKFGTTGNESLSWALNSYLPGRVAEKYKDSSIVVFSTGNVYPLVDVSSGGADESHRPGPVGEYAQSCLGRERVFEHFSKQHGTPVLIYRLNYAIDLRYGVLLEVGRSVYENQPVNLQTGHVNVIWQGDANEIAIRSLRLCTCPAAVLNVTGPETIPVRWLAEEFGKRFKKTPVFEGREQPTALLSNASRCHREFGYPSVSLQQMIDWTAGWIEHDGATLGKPTHFQQRKGQF